MYRTFIGDRTEVLDRAREPRPPVIRPKASGCWFLVRGRDKVAFDAVSTGVQITRSVGHRVRWSKFWRTDEARNEWRRLMAEGYTRG